MPRRTFEQAATITPEAVAVINQAEAQNDAAIVPYQLSDNTDLAGTLGGIQAAVFQAATVQVDAQIAEQGLQVTPLERKSMIAVEGFRQVSGLDLAAVLMRAKILHTIQEQHLLTIHPAGYQNLQEMAAENGCSVSDMSATLDMVNILFPYVQNVLEIPLYAFWSTLGKSKIKEMLPVLKAMITNQNADTATTRQAVERILQDTQAGMANADAFRNDFAVVNDQQAPEEERAQAREHIAQEARRMAILHLIELGGQLPVMELRRHMRPQRTQPIQFNYTQDGEQNIVFAELSPEQMDMLRHKMGERLDLTPIEMPDDPRRRQAQAMQVGPLRRIYQRFFGGDR